MPSASEEAAEAGLPSSRRRFRASIVFLACLAVSTSLASTRRQLGKLADLTDEWYYLGANLNQTGTLGLGTTPIVLRPPGYPFFIAVVLALGIGTPQVLTQHYLDNAAVAVYMAQAGVLSLTAMLLYLWLSTFLGDKVAMAAALAYGLNPYCLVLVGLLHYDILHMSVVVAGCLVLDQALRWRGGHPRWMLAAGLVWGVATLIRPVTLVLPAFVYVAAVLRSRFAWRPALLSAASFALGLWLVVAPWTARNYAVSGRLVPVNMQAWAATWGSTVKVLGIHPNHYNWFQLGGELVRIHTRVTGEPWYSYEGFLRFNRQLEDEFRTRALANLRRRPTVYLTNVVGGLVALNLRINAVLIQAFEYIQTPGAELQAAWFEVGNRQDFHSQALRRGFEVYAWVLTGAAWGGGWLAFRRREVAALVPGAIYACLCVAHSLTYMDLLYYYVKVPFLFVFAFLLVDGCRGISVPLPVLSKRLPVDGVMIGVLTGGALALTAAVL